MELQAAIGALSVVKEPCEIELFTDSAYVKNGITKWLHAWKRRGWTTMDKKPVKNEDLWRKLDRLAALHKVDWRWLKGHAGNVDNERCDLLACAEAAAMRTRFTREQLKTLKAEFEKKRAAENSSATLL